MLLCDRRQVGDRCRRRPQCDAAKSGTYDDRLIVAPHEPKDDRHDVDHRQNDLKRQGAGNEDKDAVELPKLQAHQSHRQEEAKREIGD